MDVLAWLEAHQLPCLVKNTVGAECPGCGFQTALLLLLKGEVVASVKTYPGLLPLLLFLALATMQSAGVKKISHRVLKFTGFVCLITILVSYLLKLITL